MKLQILLFIALIANLALSAQKPAWTWARYGDNTGAVSLSRVTHDASGNVYVTGVFTGKILLGDSDLVAIGKQSICLAKYDHSGNFIWSKNIGGTGNRAVTALAVTPDGQICVGGFFTGKIQPDNFEYSSVGGEDMFLIKYQSTGELMWAKTYGTLYDDQISGIMIGKSGNIFMNGIYSDTTFQIGPYKLSSPIIGGGGAQFFVSKQDSNGNVLWATKAADLNNDYAFDVKLDNSENIYIIGQYKVHIKFDAIDLVGISTGNIPGDVFIAKYDSAGHAIWAQTVGGYKPPGGIDFGEVFVSLLTIDSAGNPIIGGEYFRCSVIFDKYDYSTALSGRNMWMAKYSSSGNFIWAKNLGGNGNLSGATSDEADGIYLTGMYGNGCVFDTITLTNIPSGSRLGYLFVAKYNGEGRVQWVQTAGDNAGAAGFGLTAINPDEVVAVGQFYGGSSINFGSSVCRNYGTNGNGFVAKLRPGTVSVIGHGTPSFRVFPSPANSFICLEETNPRQFSYYVLKDADGRSVLNGELPVGKMPNIQVSQLACGLYLMELSGSGGSAVQKIIIQR